MACENCQSNECSCELQDDQSFAYFQSFVNFNSPRLKFDAYWIDQNFTFGETHNLLVYYYLSDKTFQIIECPKSKRQFLFLRRRKLPKVIVKQNKLTKSDVFARTF